MKPNFDKSSAAVSAALALLRAYKLLISPLFPGSCRFVPSCADYARDAIALHGALHGSWLAVRRLSRCHPLGGSGLDPVPKGPGPASRFSRIDRTRPSADV